MQPPGSAAAPAHDALSQDALEAKIAKIISKSAGRAASESTVDADPRALPEGRAFKAPALRLQTSEQGDNADFGQGLMTPTPSVTIKALPRHVSISPVPEEMHVPSQAWRASEAAPQSHSGSSLPSRSVSVAENQLGRDRNFSQQQLDVPAGGRPRALSTPATQPARPTSEDLLGNGHSNPLEARSSPALDLDAVRRRLRRPTSFARGESERTTTPSDADAPRRSLTRPSSSERQDAADTDPRRRLGRPSSMETHNYDGSRPRADSDTAKLRKASTSFKKLDEFGRSSHSFKAAITDDKLEALPEQEPARHRPEAEASRPRLNRYGSSDVLPSPRAGTSTPAGIF